MSAPTPAIRPTPKCQVVRSLSAINLRHQNPVTIPQRGGPYPRIIRTTGGLSHAEPGDQGPCLKTHEQGNGGQIEHEASRLRVTSPGGFVPGVTVDNVLTVSSRCRNLSLAQAVRSLGLAESAGVGVDRMYTSMTAVGHQPPGFATDGLTVEAVPQGGAPNEPVARFAASLPEHRRGDTDTMLVHTYLLDHRTTTAARMAKLVQRTEAEMETKLLELSAPGDGLIERTADTARSKRGEYRLVGSAVRALGPAVTYRARSGDDTDRKS